MKNEQKTGHYRSNKWGSCRTARLVTILALVALYFGEQRTFAAAPEVVPVKSLSENSSTSSGEKWKAEREADGYQLAVLGGMGRVGTKAGFALIGAGAVNLNREGWLDDVADSLYLEFQMGPYSYSGNGQLIYSGHLKWDFRYDNLWTFYALGGIGGTYTDSRFEDGFEFYPRVGLGAAYHLSLDLSVRAEVSHEFVGLGMSFHF